MKKQLLLIVTGLALAYAGYHYFYLKPHRSRDGVKEQYLLLRKDGEIHLKQDGRYSVNYTDLLHFTEDANHTTPVTQKLVKKMLKKHTVVPVHIDSSGHVHEDHLGHSLKTDESRLIFSLKHPQPTADFRDLIFISVHDKSPPAIDFFISGTVHITFKEGDVVELRVDPQVINSLKTQPHAKNFALNKLTPEGLLRFWSKEEDGWFVTIQPATKVQGLGPDGQWHTLMVDITGAKQDNDAILFTAKKMQSQHVKKRHLGQILNERTVAAIAPSSKAAHQEDKSLTLKLTNASIFVDPERPTHY